MVPRKYAMYMKNVPAKCLSRESVYCTVTVAAWFLSLGPSVLQNGVGVNGQMFKLFKDEVDCHSRRLFDTSDVSVENVYEQLQNRLKGDEVDDYLVSSLCDAALCEQKRQKRSHRHLVGCVFALQMWAMEHGLFAQNKLGKTKSCIPRILHWMQVKVGEAKVEKSFSSNEVIIEVYVSKEEMDVEIVKEALHSHHNGSAKDNLSRPSYAHIVAENEALRSIIVQQEVCIALLEEVVHKLQICHSKKMQRKGSDSTSPFKKSQAEKGDDLSGVQGGNSNSKEDYMLVDDFGSRSLQKCNQIVVYGVGKSNSKNGFVLEDDDGRKSKSENSADIFSGVVGKPEIEKGGEEMDITKSDMYTRLKGEPRKRVKSVCLKTPWTRLGRKTRRRIE
ncbi:hypothetical protein V8G54_031895 [Vigna mungo]|uniref:Uncharacterized protein n=1 Tax=Vigna mungo TaxID=3915 RepID=A0AAQ3MKH5_VIGMU